MRLHSMNSLWASKEPWLFRPESEAVITKFLQFRHRMVPYIFSAAEPLIQPMYWSFPETDAAYSVPNQYFFSGLIVAPVVKPRSKKTNMGVVKVWLPERCVDIFTGTVYDAGEMEMYRGLKEIPVLAREGAIVPLDVNPTNGCLKPDEFEVLVVVGKDGSFKLVEDEKTYTVTFDQKSGTLTSDIDRPCTFRFLAVTSKPASMKLPSGTDVSFEAYPDVPSMLIKVPGPATIELGAYSQLSVIDHTKRIEAMILDYQVEFSLKDHIWAVIIEDTALNVKMRRLMGVEPEMLGPIAELLLADNGSRGLDPALAEALKSLQIATAKMEKGWGKKEGE